MILSNDEAKKIVKENFSLSPKFLNMRKDSEMLYALINGDNFNETLIREIEYIESSKKAQARKKYSRDIQDFFERLFQPLENIWYATGGNKVYDIKDEGVKKEFLKKISNIKDSNTLSHWIQNTGVKLSHVDPNGLMFLEYTTNPKKDIFPTYKNIQDIRYYKRSGQLIDYVIFEPIHKELNGVNVVVWRIVDDLTDRTFIQIGQELTLSKSDTFEHPFGRVPAIINSNNEKIGYDYMISPIEPILGLSKEYARDLSIKTLYKFSQGFPIHWKYVTYCDDCHGRGKVDGEKCTACDGRGKLSRGDVVDVVELEVPKGDQTVIAPNIAGHVKPDSDTWDQYIKELNNAEKNAFRTFWGTLLGSEETFGGRKTTTEVIFNKQPIENRLNKYADYCEFIEEKLSKWILKFIDKTKSENSITITYGRNYVIEPSDTILRRYSEAKNVGENDIIMDELFRQYLQATYRTNPIELHKNLLKSKIEPYLHFTLKDVISVFGEQEAQKKILFSKWWDGLKHDDFNKDKDTLLREFEKWFNKNKINFNINQ